MSIITKFLQLFEYDPETDGASTFNIPKALNENWDKIDAWASGIKDTIAGLVPSTRTINKKPLSEDVTLTGEDIPAGAKDEKTLSSHLAELDSALGGKLGAPIAIPRGADLNNCKTPGLYYVGADSIVATIKNTPTQHAFVMLVEKLNDAGDCIQTLKAWSDGSAYRADTYIRSSYPEWGLGWQRLATATPPEEHAIVPKNGATLIDGFKNSYSKDQFDRVFVFFSLHFESIPERNTEIFSLPQSFAPIGGTVVGSAVLSMTAYFPATVNANQNGAVMVDHIVTGYSGPINLHGFLVIDTGGTK